MNPHAARDPEQGETSLLAAVEAISSELELRPLLGKIVAAACALLGAERGTIGLLERARGVVRTEAVYRMPEDELGSETPLGRGLAGQVLQTGEPIILDRYGDLPHPLRIDMLEDSVIGLPLRWQSELIGFFGIGAPPPRRFHEADATQLARFARHAAAALHNARRFAQTGGTLSEMQLLLQTSQRIGMAMDVSAVVKAYLEQVAAQRRYSCSVVLFELDESDARRDIVIVGRWRPEDGLTYPNGRHRYFRDDFDAVLDAGQTVTIQNTETDPRVSETLRAAQRGSGRPALALIPLMVQGERIGLVSLNHPQAHPWSEADLRPYQVTAAQLATALASRRQQAKLLEQEGRMAAYAERQRLSRDLHDSVSQLLFSLTLVAQSVGPAMRRDPEEGGARVSRLLELAQRTRAEMRALLLELRAEAPAPGPLADSARLRRDGLVATLQHHIGGLAAGGPVVTMNAEHYRHQALELEEALLRVCQEALSNALKHAHARRVDLELWLDESTCHLTIQDDGQGFDPAPTRAGHFGLATMRERAEALGGALSLKSAPGAGTRLHLLAPARQSP